MSTAFKLTRRFGQELFKALACEVVKQDKSTLILAQSLEPSKDLTVYVQNILIETYASFALGIPLKYLKEIKGLASDTQQLVDSKFRRWQIRLKPYSLEFIDLLRLFGVYYEGTLDYSLDGSLAVTKTDQRRRLGAHYTPFGLGRQMTKRVFEILTQSSSTLSSDQVLSYRVCDPSAGAGGILLEYAMQSTQFVCQLWAKENLYTELTNEQRHRLAQALIVQNCLYAHDLDAGALQVCRLSLLALAHGHVSSEDIKQCMSKAQGKSKHLHDLIHYQDLNDYPQPMSVQKTWSRLNQHIVIHNSLEPLTSWRKLHPKVFKSKNSGFDLVLGNPPYISMYGRGSQASHFDSTFLEQIQRDYGQIDGHTVLSGRLNLFLSFMVLSTQLLNKNAQSSSLIALILPDTIITNEAYTAMRQGLCLNQRLIEVQRHDVDLFKGANVGISVVIWGDRKTEQNQEALVESSSFTVTLKDKTEASEQVISESHQALLSRHACSWWPCSTKALKQAQMTEVNSVLIGEIAQVKDGFNTGSAQRRQSLLSKSNSTLNPHAKAKYRPCLEGKWVTDFKITKQALTIKTDAINSLSSGKRFEQKKIIYRQTAPHIIAAVDLEGLVYLNSAHAIILHQYDETCLFALCAYLNSDTFKKRYRLLSGETRKTFPQVHISTIKQTRIPMLITDSSNEYCIQLANIARTLSETELTQSDPKYKELYQKLNQIVQALHQELESTT